MERKLEEIAAEIHAAKAPLGKAAKGTDGSPEISPPPGLCGQRAPISEKVDDAKAKSKDRTATAKLPEGETPVAPGTESPFGAALRC